MRKTTLSRWLLPSVSTTTFRHGVIAGATAAVIGSISFALDALDILSGNSRGFDRGLELAIHHDFPRKLWEAMLIVTIAAGPVGLTVFVVALVLALFVSRAAWAAALTLLAPAGAAAAETVFKYTYNRARPHLWPHALVLHTPSFPSGHATGSMALFSILVYILYRVSGVVVATRTAVGAALVVLLVGLSRVVLGVHWPTDIAGGYAIALWWVGTLIVLSEYLTARLRTSGSRSR